MKKSKVYVARLKSNGKYMAIGRLHRVTDDIHKARTFYRQCDIKNALNHIGQRYRGDSFEILSIKIELDTHYKVRAKRTGILPQAYEHVVPTRKIAESYVSLLSSMTNLHNDYFEIVETDEPCTELTRR